MASEAGMRNHLVYLLLGLSAVASGAPTDNVTTPAQLTQWGYVTDSGNAAQWQAAMDLPDFLHRQVAGMGQVESPTSATNLLAWSAIYTHLPEMTITPYKLTISMGMPGRPQAWYPAAEMTADRVTWLDVTFGEPAEGPETTHPLWMMPRAVSRGATSLVDKAGRPGANAGDAGTTEGEVFLFVRAYAAQAVPLKGSASSASVVIKPLLPGLRFDEGGRSVWVLEGGARPRFVRGELTEGGAAVVAGGDSASAPNALSLGEQIMEPLVGNGMIPDEARAAVNVVLADLAQRSGRYALFVLPPAYVESKFPLTVQGAAEIKNRTFIAVTRIEEQIPGR